MKNTPSHAPPPPQDEQSNHARPILAAHPSHVPRPNRLTVGARDVLSTKQHRRQLQHLVSCLSCRAHFLRYHNNPDHVSRISLNVIKNKSIGLLCKFILCLYSSYISRGWGYSKEEWCTQQSIGRQNLINCRVTWIVTQQNNIIPFEFTTAKLSELVHPICDAQLY